MSKRDAELLRDRSIRQLTSAKRSLSSGDYDIAAFMAEQSFQLYLKSMLLEQVGEIPRTHSARQLLLALKTAFSPNTKIDAFVRENRSLLIRLEDTYINSRYVPREYEKEEAQELVDFVEESITFVKSLKGKT